MLRHGIRSEQVRAALEAGERIEQYPDDAPYPRYLALGWPEGGRYTLSQPTTSKGTRQS